MNIPSVRSFDVLDDQLHATKVQGSDGIESNIEQDKGPFEQGVDCVSCSNVRSVTGGGEE